MELMLAQAEVVGVGLIFVIWLTFLAFGLGMAVLMIASMWKLFTKAGKEGWMSLIPILNVVVMCEIVGRPTWWVLLMFIPCANIIVAFLLAFDLAEAYGQGAGYGIGLVLLPYVFYPMLGFGSARYLGPVRAPDFYARGRGHGGYPPPGYGPPRQGGHPGHGGQPGRDAWPPPRNDYGPPRY